MTAIGSFRHLLFLVLTAVCLANSASKHPYDDIEHVEAITSMDDFKAKVWSSPSVWLLHFYDGTPSPDEHGSMHFVADLLNGICKVGAVDVSINGDIADLYKLRKGGLAVIGDDNLKPLAKHEGTDWTLQQAIDYVTKNFLQVIQTRANRMTPGAGTANKNKDRRRASSNTSGPSPVLQVTAASFEKDVLQSPGVVAVAFTAPWCGHCKRLEPVWDQAARELDGQGAVLAWVDATAETSLAQRYQVTGYPTIKIFAKAGTKSYEDAEDHQGDRSVEGVVDFLRMKVDRAGIPREIPEMVDMATLEKHCGGHNHICVMVALPHILESGAEGRNKYRGVLANVSKSFRSFGFLWLEGSSQPSLESALEMTFGYPAVVALSLDRKAYAVFRGSFSEKSISGFLNSVVTGRQATVPMTSLPTIETVTPWDGLDGAPVEEEFDLSDLFDEGEL